VGPLVVFIRSVDGVGSLLQEKAFYPAEETMPQARSTRSSKTKRARVRPKGESEAERARRARAIYRKLLQTYPEATCALRHRNPYELLVATVLSAQCTDERVNKVTPALFRKYPTPAHLARAVPAELEAAIRSTGFYRNKSKALRSAATDIVEKHGGQVPDTMEALTALHGVARKTANVVLGNAFGKNEGVVVDTHVLRLSRRMGLTTEKDPNKVERELMALFPRRHWAMLAHLLIWHGRRICQARKPACAQCSVNALCPKVGVDGQ